MIFCQKLNISLNNFVKAADFAAIGELGFSRVLHNEISFFFENQSRHTGQ